MPQFHSQSGPSAPQGVAAVIGQIARCFGTILLVTALFQPVARGDATRGLYDTASVAPGANAIDGHVRYLLREHGRQPAPLCSDAVFIRRVFIDVIGTLPEPEEVEAFLASTRSDKRAALIDSLLQRDEFADYWSLKWCDALRVKSEFPINLWPNAVQAYHRWVWESIRDNKPYDQFARELLTSSGSNFRVPPVNYYRAIQGQDSSAIAAAVSLTFMGSRIESWPAERRAGMEKLFSRVRFKSTGEWKEQIVYLDPSAVEPMEAMLPDGTLAQVSAWQDPRVVFADWLIRPDNPAFNRAICNRIWVWLLGRGIIHEADDIRPDNPPSNPKLLGFLEAELVRTRYDLRHVYRLILNSQTYQQSSIPADAAADPGLFASYAVRRLDAEVLIDAICSVLGSTEQYSSPIPEPFTYIPDHQRTIALADASITSTFLEMFGRPTRDTGLMAERDSRISDAQRLHLLNSTHIQRKIANSGRLRDLTGKAGNDHRQLVRSLYLLILSREPVEAEVEAALAYAKSNDLDARQAVQDLAWALINSKEFLYRH